jgi:hypothetical protein
MAWRVTLNRSHVGLWVRWCIVWLAWVGWALILGAHLHPRWDEIVFAISLPCFVLLPYMIGTFILACIKLLLPVCYGPRVEHCSRIRDFHKRRSFRPCSRYPNSSPSSVDGRGQ